jgi:hypothetical protein
MAVQEIAVLAKPDLSSGLCVPVLTLTGFAF